MMTSNKDMRFSDYASKHSSLKTLQSKGIAIAEVGQNWDFMLTLRLANQLTSKNAKFAQNTADDRALLQHIATYMELLERRTPRIRRRSQAILRSVYLHKLGNEFHAHIYAKYPLHVLPQQWDITLGKEWLKLPKVRGADTNKAINFHQLHKEYDSLRWGNYGIKGNVGKTDNETTTERHQYWEETAWIDNLSHLPKPLDEAMAAGERFLSVHSDNTTQP
jgi:hypothetical protein